jgi:hypothetical protein
VSPNLKITNLDKSIKMKNLHKLSFLCNLFAKKNNKLAICEHRWGELCLRLPFNSQPLALATLWNLSRRCDRRQEEMYGWRKWGTTILALRDGFH